ncbi:Hypothetical predicted protein [Paramuricea clavata]|uniref:Uncharacterized protein n=1 Tax=Paramuricea clavata TaxID=317549 RepID=A0A7D9HW57_PARCT|nr:Hypothetical predicted protein [Paramuricea clavata]
MSTNIGPIMSRLQFLLFVILLNVLSTSQERLCRYKKSGGYCRMHCCGKPDDKLLCLDSCDGISCSKSDDCDDDGCCNSGKCTNIGCKTPWYVIATPVLVIVLAVCIAAYRIWCVKNRRVSQAGVIVSVVGRDGQLYAHDDSVALLTGDDGVQEQAQGSEQPTAQTTWKEMPDLPPPYVP